ncbi:MAG: hypothetical protein JXA73_18055 [Acidobacteria bacterium]|nr:hypothetical protein [Acidobacteriota bacterium]
MTTTVYETFAVQVAGGPALSYSNKVEVEGIDLIEVEVPDKNTAGGKATVNVQPGNSGVQLLAIKLPEKASLQYKVDGGTDQTLDQPLLLLGEGAVKLLGSTQKQFKFTNSDTNPVKIQILVGRKATA